MKKITFLLFALLFSFVGYSQFPTPGTEGFENTTGPDLALPVAVSPWTLGTGTTGNQWAVFDNGVAGSPQKRWDRAISNFYNGTQAAFINRKQNGAAGVVSEDYLATPLVTVPANGQLTFYTRTGFNVADAVNYLIKVNTNTTAGSQTTLANYTTTVQSWDQTTIAATYNVYELKTVDLSAYAGQQIFIAFVRNFNQPTAALGGNSWYIDDVKLVQRCLEPTTLTATGITQSTANLSWTNPSGSTSWEIEVIPSTSSPTGVGVVYNGTLPYIATGLTPTTGYVYYVRSLCSNSNSNWVGPYNFTTLTPGLTCATAITVSSLPYSTTDNTANYGDTYDVTQPTACAGTATNYMQGNDVFYSYTAATTGAISVTMTPTGSSSGVFVYQGCSNVGVTCLAGVANTGSGVRTIPSLNVTAGQTYIIVLSSSATTQTYPYSLVIQQLNCAQPTALAVANTTSTGTQLSWTNTTSTSWEYAVQTAGSPIPTGSGTQTSSSTNTPVTGLTPDTAYQYWVRADCGNGTFSAWAGPFAFTTAVAPPVCGGLFVDAGGQAGNYANNSNITYPICPVNPGDQVTVTFTSFNTQLNTDLLKVYNGNGTSGTLLATYSGTTIPPAVTSSSPDGCLTFVFTSDGTTNAAGWVANVTCAPAPSCQRPIVLATSAILYNSVTLGWTQPQNPDTSVASAWEVIALPCGSAAPTATTTGVISASSNPFPVPGLSPLTCYDFYVRAVCSSSNSSLWSGPVSATTPIAPPVCGGNFVDSGGISGNYSNNENTPTLICPTNSTDVVTVSFTAFNTQANNDVLKVYDGSNASAPLIGTYSGNLTATLPGPIVSSVPGGCLYFVFTSNATTTRAGWVANVTCAPPPTCPKPTALVASAVTSNSGTLAWTNNSTATQFEMLALPCGSAAPTASSIGTIIAPTTNTYTFAGLTPLTCYTLYVRAVCSSSDSSLWSAGVNITTLIAPPACGGNFVDSGGASGNYANNENITTTICATNPTDLVTVTFTSFSVEDTFDFLSVYDGNSATGTLLGTYTGTTLPPAMTNSTPGGCLTFVFTSDSSVTSTGWVANITCAPAPTCSIPKTLLVVSSSATSATLSWTQPQNPDTTTASSWQIIIQPAGTGVPSPTAIGLPVSSLPYIVNGLTPGTSYEFYVRAVCSLTDSSPWSTVQTFYTAVSCADAQPFCGSTGQTYVNTTGAPDSGTIGCLFTTPNPAWFYMQVAQSGNLAFNIHQGSNAPAFNNEDVDFIAWGPFTPDQFSTMCVNLYDYPSGNTSVPNNVVGCSYSAAATENFTIPSAIAGNYYLVLITNYSDNPGTVVFNQTNIGTSGAGSTDCNIVCSVNLGPDVQLCNQSSYTITSSNQGATAYAWYNGATLIAGQTGSTLTVTQSGNYSCTVTCGLNTSSDSINVTFNNTITPSFLIPTTVCQSSTAAILPSQSNDSPAITGTWLPATIDTSTVGLTSYTFTPAIGQCASPISINVTVNPSVIPLFLTPEPICAGATAPVLPTTSTNGITGTWSPSTVSNTASGTYTFTPTSGQCASTVTMNITVNTNCAFGSYASAVWLANCSTSNFFNTVGSGADIIGPSANIFPDSNLGTYLQNSSSLMLKGAEIKTFKNASSNVCSARLNYRIYPQAGTPGTFQVMDLPWFSDCGSGAFNVGGGPCNVGDQKWHKVLPDALYPTENPIDLTTYPPGNYTIQVYYDISGSSTTTTGCSETVLIDNNGAYYTASFTIQAQPSYASTNPTTCGGTNGTITISGMAPNTSYGVSYIQNTEVIVGPQTISSDNNGTIVINGLNAGTYSNFLVTINGCSYPYNTPIVLVDPTPPSVTVNSPTVCASQPATVTATPASIGTYSYAWTVPSSVTDPGNVATFTTSVAGVYSVIITDATTGCLSTSASGTVGFNTVIVPTFATIPTICNGATAPVLPTSSTNGTPITGTWLPATIDSTVAGDTTFTFTPDLGQCSQPISIVVTVTPAITIQTTVTQPTCALPSGTIQVTSPISSLGATPTDLFISEATDSNSGSLSYVELYNGTGATINLSNYSIKTANNGGAYTFTLPLNNVNLATGSTYVIALGNDDNCPSTPGGDGSLAAQSSPSGSVNFAVNGNDHFGLFNGTTQIDSWGTFGNSNWAPSSIGTEGADFRRKNNISPLPNTIYNNSDWDIIDYAGSGVTNCANNDYSNIGIYSLPPVSNYQYSIDGGTYSSNTTFAGLPPGDHIVSVLDTTTGCSASTTVTINIATPVPAVTTFSYTSPVCANVAATLTPIPGVGFTSGGQYTASPVGLLIDANTGVVNLAASTPGTYSVTYAVLDNSALCISGTSSSTPLVINVVPTATVNSPSACAGQSATVTATALPSTGTYNYIWTNTVGATDPGNVSSFGATMAGTYTVIVTDALSGCASASASGTVTINALPTVTVNNPTVCQGQPATVTAVASPTGTYSYVWTVPTGASNPGNVATFNATVAGSYGVAITDTTTGCTSLSVTSTVTINALPTVTVTGDTVCQGSQATITANPIPTTGTYNYVWTGPTTPGNVASFTTTTAGTYSVIITDTTTGCTSVSASGTAAFIPAFDFTINGECINNDFILEVVPTGSSFDLNTSNFTWQFDSNTVGSNNATFDVTSYVHAATPAPQLPLTFSVNVTTADGCQQSHPITLDRIYCDIQKGISPNPNPDGKNDFFDLRLLNVQQLSIFNRYGTKVYSKGDYTDEWIGQSDSGSELPDGTYYYVIDFKNDQPTKTGWIYINRQNK